MCDDCRSAARGWEQFRQRRYERQIELGLIVPAWPLSPPSPGVPAGESLDEAKRDELDLKMAVYAAMVDTSAIKQFYHLPKARTELWLIGGGL